MRYHSLQEVSDCLMERACPRSGAPQRTGTRAWPWFNHYKDPWDLSPAVLELSQRWEQSLGCCPPAISGRDLSPLRLSPGYLPNGLCCCLLSGENTAPIREEVRWLTLLPAQCQHVTHWSLMAGFSHEGDRQKEWCQERSPTGRRINTFSKMCKCVCV